MASGTALTTNLPDLTIFTDGKGRLCQAWKGKYYPEDKDGYFASGGKSVHILVWKFHLYKISKLICVQRKNDFNKCRPFIQS